jgi:NAD dependent epimerase/dehydratase
MNRDWNGKRVLITGAGGFIGSHLTERLVKEGARVRAFVRYNSRGDVGMLGHLPKDILNGLEIVAGDLRELPSIHMIVKGADIVFHLGALVSIPYSYLHPFEVAETNLLGTLNVLQACRQEGVNRLVHVSTSEVYGTAQRVPIDEEHILQAQSPYSATKIGADKLAESYYSSFDLPVVVVRPFNTYGPRQSARAVIPAIITQALTLNIIRLGRLDTSRDFTFVGDTVDGLIKAALAKEVEGMVFNLGTGIEIRIGDLARQIMRTIGRPGKIITDPARVRPGKSEVLRLLSNNSQAQQYLNWEPSVSFEQGLKQTIEWIQAHLDMYKVGTYEF